MRQQLKCSQGHQWEVDDGAPAGDFDSCPTCGDKALTIPPVATPVAAAASAAALPVVPGYDILEQLGQGGMGVVYKARQKSLNRTVALKMILAGGHASGAALAQFRREAEAVARLNHPNIVKIHEIGEHNRTPYIVLEFVAKGTLAGQLKGQAQKAHYAATVVKLLAEAVQHAHEQKVLHRDLKPANVHVGERSALKISDFGLAKFLDAGPGESTSGAPKGTPSYMAPEQVLGSRVYKGVGPPTDVYALGAILYECLTGRPPFRGEVREVLNQVLEKNPESPRRLNDKVARDLETICLKCLEKRPRDRYGTARELADDLGRFLNGEAVRARPVGRVGRLWRWAARNPYKAGTAAAVTVALFLLALWLGSAYLDDRRTRRGAEQLAESGEELYQAGQYDMAHERLSAAAFLVKDRSSQFDDLRKRIGGRLEQAAAQLMRVRFGKKADEAEYHLLGGYWTLRPHEDPEGRLRLPHGTNTGASLDKGVELAQDALALYGLREGNESAAAFATPGLDDREAVEVRRRAGEVLFLLARAVERQAQAGPGHDAARRRAMRLLTAAKELGYSSQELYVARGEFRRQEKDQAGAEDDEAAAKQTPTAFYDHHFRAFLLSRSHSWVEAAKEYQAALDLRRNEYWTLFRLAKLLERFKELGRAEALFQSCVALRPDDPTAYNNRGTILQRLKRYPEAIKEFETALAKDPDYYVAYGNLMLVYAEQKQPEKTKAVLQRFLDRHPDRPQEQARAWDALGVAYERAGNDAKALEYYTKAVEVDEKFAGAHRNRSILLAKRRQYPEAEDAIKRAIKLSEHDGELRYVLGDLYAAEALKTEEAEARAIADVSLYQKAITAYNEALERDKDLWIAQFNRAEILWRLEQLPEALKDLDQIVEEKPKFLEARYTRALVNASLRNYEAALKDLSRLGDRGNDPEFLRTRGKVLADLGVDERPGRAATKLTRELALALSEADLTRAVELDPEEPDGYRGRAVTRIRAENWQGALDDFRQYLALAPRAADAPGVHNDMSNALLYLGREQEALDELKKVPDLTRQPSTLTSRGNVYLRFGQFKSAVADFKAALGLQETHTRAWALLGQACLHQARLEDAVNDLGRAIHAPRGRYETLVLRAVANYARGDSEKALADLDEVADDTSSSSPRVKFARAMRHYLKGRYDEALYELPAAIDDPVLGPFARIVRARTWLALGGRGKTLALADARALADKLRLGAFAQWQAACVCAMAGEKDEAVKLLRGAVRLQPTLRATLAKDLALKSLADDASFQELIREP